MRYVGVQRYAYVTCRQVNLKRSYDNVRTIPIFNTCLLQEIEVTISGTITVTDLFLSIHVLIWYTALLHDLQN